MMIKLIESSLQGCFEIKNRLLEDERCAFVNIYHRPTFEWLGLDTDFFKHSYWKFFK